MPKLFKWYHYESTIIMLAVRWYFRYALSFADLVEILSERGLTSLNKSTIYRWCYKFGRTLEKRIKPHLNVTNGSWRTDETYIKVKGVWHYLYRAVDKCGNTIDFFLSPKRDQDAAKIFFRKALKNFHVADPYSITTDKDKAYQPAIADLKAEGLLAKNLNFRQIKYLNNIIESDHRRIKKLVRPCLGFESLNTASSLIAGFETMMMIKKGQLLYANTNVNLQNELIDSVMGVVA